MPDINRVPMRLGGVSATQIAEIIAGTTTIDIPSVSANGAIASASGIAAGVSGAHNVVVLPRAWAASESVIIAAAVGIANGIQITAANPSAAAINPTSQTVQFFAWR